MYQRILVATDGSPQSEKVVAHGISLAALCGAELMVMAAHARKGIQRLLLGSETMHVLTHATVPVLVLR